MDTIFQKKISNCIIISKTSGFFTFNSFKTIQAIIIKNKKLYKNVWFKKIPNPNSVIFIHYSEIILEFIISIDILNILKLIKFIAYKISFKLKFLYLKK